MLAILNRPANFTETATGSQIVERYNELAHAINAPAVKRFENRTVALKRLDRLEEQVRERLAEVRNPERKRRQKVFNYPAASTQKAVAADSLRGRALALLRAGATLGRMEELCAEFDRERGQEPRRLEPRAYGLVRLLHTWAGYGLREEGTGDHKVIYAMDAEAWKAWKARKTDADQRKAEAFVGL